MIWPKPFNVRMSKMTMLSLISNLAEGGREQFVITGYPEYGGTLDANQSAILDQIATIIISSFSTDNSITAIAVIGHADTAAREPLNTRVAKEMAVSKARAESAVAKLIELLEFKTRTNGTLRGRVDMLKPNIQAVWVGSAEAVPNQIAKNRKVVFKWARSFAPPPIHPPVPILPNPGKDPDKDLSISWAATKFRLKILDSVSGALAAGLTEMTVAIWDIENNRLAFYEYSAVTVGASLGFDGGESQWTDFTTVKPIPVDQFSGSASHFSLSGLLTQLKFTIRSVSPNVTIVIMGLSAKSVGVESSPKAGSLDLIKGTLQLYDGGDLPNIPLL